MNRVLLTGGTGFLGSHVAELLVARGDDVRATIRASSDTRWIAPLPIETVRADLTRPDDLAAALEGVRDVVHVGGVTIATDPSTFERVNAAGTGALAAAAGAAGVERFVYVSSLAARGPDGAEGPVSPYGHSKLGGERRLEELAAAGKAPPVVRVLRPGGIYGPRDPDMLALFRMAARGFLVLPAVEGRLQPVHVVDVARAVVGALADETSGDPGPLPVAAEEILSWADVGDALEHAVGRPVRRVRMPAGVFLAAGGAAELATRVTGGTPTFDRRRARDLTRRTYTTGLEATRAALGWAPEIGIREGMAATVAWYREHGWMPR